MQSSSDHHLPSSNIPTQRFSGSVCTICFAVRGTISRNRNEYSEPTQEHLWKTGQRCFDGETSHTHSSSETTKEVMTQMEAKSQWHLHETGLSRLWIDNLPCRLNSMYQWKLCIASWLNIPTCCGIDLAWFVSLHQLKLYSCSKATLKE